MFTIHIDTDHSGISPYAVMILLSFAAGISAIYIMNVRSGVRKNIAGYLALLSPVMSAFGAIFMTYLTTAGQFIGLSSMGGMFGMYAGVFTIALIGVKREEAIAILQNCTLILPLMYSISKLGCLFAGCCHGIEYHGLFCVEYTGNITDTICVFPVQLAETIVFFLIFAIGVILFKKHSRNACFAVIFASAAAKGLLDFTRESHTGKILSLNQVLCLIVILIGIILKYTAINKANNY